MPFHFLINAVRTVHQKQNSCLKTRSNCKLFTMDSKAKVEALQQMLTVRAFDRQMFKSQRQGLIGTYPMLEGQEAVQVGASLAMSHQDWAYLSYREQGVQVARGMPWETIISYWRGLPNATWRFRDHRTSIITVPIATQLMHAVGHGRHIQRVGLPEVTVAFFGDGATSETDFHSSMNFAAVWNTPTVFLCQNNGYAISVPFSEQTVTETVAEKALAYGMSSVRVDGMDVEAVYGATSRAIQRARAGQGPQLIDAVCYRFGAHATADDASLYRSKAEELAWRERDPVATLETSMINAGHWAPERTETETRFAIDRFAEALANVEQQPLPARTDIVRHVYERTPIALTHQMNELLRDLNEVPVEGADRLYDQAGGTEPSTVMTMAAAIGDALAIECEQDPMVTVLGEDVGLVGGVFRITKGLQKRFGKDRIMDTPLNESGIVGAAIGMAMAGGRPVAEIQFDGFVYPAFDQIVSHLARMRFRTRGDVALPVVVRVPNGPGIAAHEHHCDSPEGYFCATPGLVVVCPSTPADAKGLLASAIRSNDPVIFIEPKVLYFSSKGDVPVGEHLTPLGQAIIRKHGTDLTIVTYGAMVRASLEAAESVPQSIEVIDLRTLSPWDTETVLESVAKTGRLLAVQDAGASGSVGANVVSFIASHGFEHLIAPPRLVAAVDAPWPQFAIESHALVGPDRIRGGIRRMFDQEPENQPPQLVSSREDA